MKKQSMITLAVVASLGLMSVAVFAEDRGVGGEQEQKGGMVPTLYQDGVRPQERPSSVSNEVRPEDDEEMDVEDIDDEGVHQEESDLRKEIDALPDIKQTITLRSADADTVITYADVATLLNEYKSALDTIDSPIVVSSSTLSVQELQLFSTLKAKHTFELSRTSARAAELRSQIADLLNLISPLGTQTINESAGLKKSLFGAVNDIRGAILDLGDLHDTSNTLLYEETN